VRSNLSSLDFLTDGSAALPIKVGATVISNSYGDIAPTNGLFVKGAINYGGGLMRSE
jgi:hypothetical protein